MARSNKKLIPVENAPDLERDPDSKAVISNNNSAYYSRIQTKNKEAAQNADIKALRAELDELKAFVASFIKSST